MSEMVERVARAIASSLDVSPESWQENVDEARAAIEAMREPTKEMTGCEVCGRSGRELWNALIDEALK